MRRHRLIRRRPNLQFGNLRRKMHARKNPEETPHQHFDYLWYTWDINKAEALIAKRRKRDKDIQEIDVAHVYGSINWSTPDRPTFGGTIVNPEYALTKADVTKPLIFGLFKDKTTWFSILIDGHHRLYRAQAEGLAKMPAYFLNKRENYHSMLGPRRAPLKKLRRKLRRKLHKS